MHRLATIHNVTVDDGDRRTQHYMAKNDMIFLSTRQVSIQSEVGLFKSSYGSMEALCPWTPTEIEHLKYCHTVT